MGYWSNTLPFVPGSYAAKGLKAASRADDVVNSVKTVKKVGRTGKQARLRALVNILICKTIKVIKLSIDLMVMEGEESKDE